MQERLKILLLEDSFTDAEIVQRLLIKEDPSFEFSLAMNKHDYLKGLDNFMPDVILSDNSLPQFSASEALDIIKQRKLYIPFIMVTGTVSEEFAADIIKSGADDYILKDRLSRLPAAIDAALKQRRAEKEKLVAQQKVIQSEERYRLLFERNLAGVYQSSVDGNVLTCNEALANMLGYESCDELHEKNADLVHYSATGRDEMISLLLKKKQLTNYEATLMHKDGRPVYVIENISLLKDPVNGEQIIEGVIVDITERKKAEEAIKAMEEKIQDQKVQEQKKITRAVIKAQEEERIHIGQELHDNVCQILVGAKLHLGVTGEKDDELKRSLKYPMDLINNSIDEIRLLSHKLVAPLKNIDLEELVRVLLYELAKSTGLRADLTYDIAEQMLTDELKLNIYRLLQEQVNNIFQHAGANNITVSIVQAADAITIVIRDDGRGFNVNEKRKGIGISNMLNRVESYNGRMVIESSPGMGCMITIAIPWNSKELQTGQSDN